MKEIPLEKRLERYDSLSDILREALNSDEITHMLWAIGEAHHLGEERTFKVVKIVGYIMVGFIHPQDLQREIASEIAIDKRLADEIAREIQVKILNPLIPEINAAFNYHVTGVPAAAPVPTAELTQPTIIKPAFAPPPLDVRHQTSDIRSDTPFILHEEQKEIERARPREETLMRPSFYDPSIDSGQEGRETIDRPAAARLEMGGVGEEKAKEPQIGKTEEPQIRVVHYTGPQTPVDPFGSQASDISNQTPEDGNQKAEPPPQQPPKEVHPENVVDLKDLPK